jgi:hypothetical protein
MFKTIADPQLSNVLLLRFPRFCVNVVRRHVPAVVMERTPGITLRFPNFEPSHRLQVDRRLANLRPLSGRGEFAGFADNLRKPVGKAIEAFARGAFGRARETFP